MQPIQTDNDLDQTINLTKILHVYLDSGNHLENPDHINTILDLSINKIAQTTQDQASTTQNQAQISKLTSLREALKGIQEHHSTLPNMVDPKPLKSVIKDTLGCYKKYFSIKFSKDGTPETCDPDIKKILSNFDDNRPFFQSLSTINDNDINLKSLAKFLNEYLAKLAISAESKINDDNPNQDESEQKKHIDKIKTTLLTFPGGVSGDETIPFVCLAGTMQRLQDVIFSLNDSSQELISVNDEVKIFATRLTPKVLPGEEIHVPPCLLGSLTMDKKKIEEIDTFHNLPKKNIELIEILSFCHSFSEKVKKDLLDPRSELINQYRLLLEGEGENGKKVIKYEKFNSFLGIAEFSGFKIDGHGLMNPDADLSDTIETSNLISLEQFKEKYLKIPTEKFEKESSKIGNLPETDYLRYIPDPKDLFKISEFDGETTNRLDIAKINTLIDLFPRKIETEVDSSVVGVKSLISKFSDETKDSTAETATPDEIAKKSKMSAGLITLRNILDDYKTSNDRYFYFLKFDHEFTKTTGKTFEDFFFDKEYNKKANRSKSPILIVKSEFSEQKLLLENIKDNMMRQKEIFHNKYPSGLHPANALEYNYDFINTLISIKDFNQVEFSQLFNNENFINLKNNHGENLLNILYQFDEEAFKKALEINPQLIETIQEKDGKGLSLIKKLTQKDLTNRDNAKLLFDVLEKYKKHSISPEDEDGKKALTALITKDDLLSDLNKKISNGDTILLLFCKKGHTENVKALIEAGVDLNIANRDRKTPLQIACEKGHTEIAKALIEAKVDLNKIDTNTGETYLHIACKNGHTEIAKALIEAEVDLNIANRDGKTPLQIACEKGHTEIVKAFIGVAGVDLNIANRDGKTPLQIACEKGHTEIVKALIEKGVDLNQTDTNTGETYLHIACKNGHTEIVKAFIGVAGVDLNKAGFLLENDSTPLQTACENNHTEIAKALIKAGANLYEESYWGKKLPLQIACEKGHTEIAKALIEKGVDLNQTDFRSKKLTPLKIACEYNQTEIVKALFEAGADTSFLKQKSSNIFSCFRGNSSTEAFTPEINKLITKITDPKEITIRDQNLRQIKFNKENANLLQSFLDPSDPATNAPIDISEIRLRNPSQEAGRDGDVNKEVANCLLFLKFVASEFSSKTKSTLTSDEKISKMLAIYLENNNHASFITPIIDDVIKNKDGLRDFLTNKSSEELINLSKTNSLSVAVDNQGTKDIVEDKLRQLKSNSSEASRLEAHLVIAPPRSFAPLSCFGLPATRRSDVMTNS